MIIEPWDQNKKEIIKRIVIFELMGCVRFKLTLVYRRPNRGGGVRTRRPSLERPRTTR